MATATVPQILVCADRLTTVDEAARLLGEAGYGVALHPLDGGDPAELTRYHLILVEGTSREPEALRFCRRLRARVADTLVPIVFVTADHSPGARLASLEGGADTYLLRPFAPGELLAQVQAFLRLKEMHDRLADKTAEVQRVHKRLQLAYQQIDHELELARRLQLSFLPQKLPELPTVRFAVHYRTCGQVGGDFYDVFRLDEDNVGFYVADAMGHGVPASLLTIFIKKAVRAKEIVGRDYRLLPPGEVLQQLNREMLDQALAETPFITMVYALLNARTRTLAFARAGHPHPLYVPRQGAPHFWKVHGTLLGVFETSFPVQTQTLHPGDKLLLYTDGLDPNGPEGEASGLPRLPGCAARHRHLPVEEFVASVAEEMGGGAEKADDFTLLGVELSG